MLRQVIRQIWPQNPAFKSHETLVFRPTSTDKLDMSRPKKKNPATVHFRRCHVCTSVTEVDGTEVKKCGSCGKMMAPFFFFEDASVIAHSDHEPRPQRLKGKVVPILGFTAYW